jgi:hypothetical protein
MPEGAAEIPIPVNLREAFEDALGRFADWDRGGPEPLISLERKSFTVAAISDFVMMFSDPAPENIYNAVLNLAQDFRAGPEALGHECDGPTEQTYASVARCLLMLYRARVAHYERVALRRS